MNPHIFVARKLLFHIFFYIIFSYWWPLLILDMETRSGLILNTVKASTSLSVTWARRRQIPENGTMPGSVPSPLRASHHGSLATGFTLSGKVSTLHCFNSNFALEKLTIKHTVYIWNYLLYGWFWYKVIPCQFNQRFCQYFSVERQT